MESRGWVRHEADAADARIRRLQLTDDGQALARKTLAAQAEVVRAMVADTSDAELDQVRDSMQRVSQRLEALREADALSRASAPRSRAGRPARRG
jgi:DNA-binding MarR family transcriptional regulator